MVIYPILGLNLSSFFQVQVQCPQSGGLDGEGNLKPMRKVLFLEQIAYYLMVHFLEAPDMLLVRMHYLVSFTY